MEYKDFVSKIVGFLVCGLIVLVPSYGYTNDMRSIAEDGAKCDGVTDDTIAIRSTIEYCKINKCGVFIPSSTTSCLVTSPIKILNANGLVIAGVSRRMSHIRCIQDDDCFVIGDGTALHQGRDVILKNFEIFQKSASALWGIKCLNSADLIIEQMQIANFSTLVGPFLGGGIYLNACIAVNIRENVIGGIQAGNAGISAINGVNSATISGNRIDGINATGGYGMRLRGRALTVIGNVTESLLVCQALEAGTGLHIAGNYFENCGTAILNNVSYIQGVGIYNNYFHTTGSSTYPIMLQYAKQTIIKGNSFTGAPPVVDGYRTAIYAAYPNNSDWEVGLNSLRDVLGNPPFIDQEIVLDPSFVDKNIVLWK